MKFCYSAFVAVLFPALVQAAPITSTVVFETAEQSIWENGTGSRLEPFSKDLTLSLDTPQIRFPPGSPLNIFAQLDETSKVGVGVDLKFDSGTVDAVVPFSAGLDFNYAEREFTTGGFVTIDTFANLDSANAMLQTRFPVLQFNADLIADLSGTVGAQGCVGIQFVIETCAGVSTGFETGLLSTELIAINKGGDGEIRLVEDLQNIFGAVNDTVDTVRERKDPNDPNNTEEKTTLVLAPATASLSGSPILSADVSLPDFETNYSQVAGLDTLSTVENSGRFLDLELDIDALLTASGLLPVPLEINANLNAGPASVDLRANLLDVDLEAGFDVKQKFTLKPELVVDYTFTRDVTVRVDGGPSIDLAAGEKLEDLRAGTDSFELDWDNTGPLQIIPNYELKATLFNETSLDLGLMLAVEALSASASVKIAGYNAGSVGFGPLIDETFDLEGLIGAPSIDIRNDLLDPAGGFNLGGFQSMLAGNAITLDNTGAVFTNQGVSSLWRDDNNWVGDAPDQGLNVVIDLQNVPGSNNSVVVDDNRNGGDLVIGDGVELFVVGGASSLRQNEGAGIFSNAGNITVLGGLVEAFAPVTGGGSIILDDGTLAAKVNPPLRSPAGLWLRGQDVVGRGGDTINTTARLTIDNGSAIRTEGAFLDLNIADAFQTINRGTIESIGSVLNWKIQTDQDTHVIHNDGGLITASNGGTISIDLEDNPVNPGRLRISGGELATDASSTIVFRDDLSLFNAPYINGNVTVEGDVRFQAFPSSGELVNDGFFSFEGATVEHERTYTLSGNGIAQFDGRIDASSFEKETCIFFICTTETLPGSAMLINGADHTLQGAGDIFSGISLINDGTINANSATSSLTILADTINNGTLSATGAGGLVLAGSLDTSNGNISANGGDVTVTGSLVGGSTTGPGGVWTANNSTISLENGASQWQSLAADFSSLAGGEIVLAGNSARFMVDGSSIENSLDHIASTGTLRLIDTDFQRSTEFDSAEVTIAGELNLLNSTFDVLRDIPNPFSGTGRVTVNSGGLIHGDGTIIADQIVNRGTIRAEGVGKTLTLDGGIAGGGKFVATNGSILSVDLGTCGFLGIPCPFSRVGAAGSQISGNHFIVDSDGADTEISLTGLGDLALVRNLANNARVEINGANAELSMFAVDCFLVFCDDGDRSTLGQTLQNIMSSALVLSGGKQFVSDQVVTLSNNSTLQLADATTTYFGAELNVLTGSTVDLLGGTLNVGALNLGSGTTLEGFGTITRSGVASTISNAGSIMANNGVLDIMNSAITQTGAGVLGAADIIYALDVAQTQSTLRLTNTSVDGGAVQVGVNASLTGNGKFNNVDASNAGTIVASDIGDGITSFIDSTLDNLADSLVQVSNAVLSLGSTVVTNADSAEIRVMSNNTDPANSVLQLADSTINGGALNLTSASDVTLVPQADPDAPNQRIESAPATQAILQGYGTLSNVDLLVDAFSMVDANVQDERLTFDIGTGSINNFGLMRASDGGILKLSGGTVAGTGTVLARADSLVEIENINFDGVSLTTEGSGVIRDIATSSFSNLANSGNFEVAGEVTVIGNLNNTNGFIRILNNGSIVLAEGTLADGSALPFALAGGTLLVDQGGTVVGNNSDLVAIGAAVGGSGIIDADVALRNGSLLIPGGDGAAGMLSITGMLATSADSSIMFDVFSDGTFDQLVVDGPLDLAGTVVFNFMEDLIMETFAQTFSIFDFFLGPAQDISLFSNLVFESLSPNMTSTILLADNGMFSFSDIGTPPPPPPPPTSVPEPGTLPMMAFALFALYVIRQKMGMGSVSP